MDENLLVELLRQTLFLIIKVSSPMLITSLVIGLVVSVLQTVTSVQEQTLTFVPKLIGVFLVIMLCGNWIMKNITEYFWYLADNFRYFIQ